MRTLITGAAGFVGGYLARFAAGQGSEVLGLDIPARATERNDFRCAPCDVRDQQALADLIARFRPDRVFHLAAQSYPTVSWAKPWETMETNAGGTIHLFESLRSAGLAPVVVVACSSAEYGFVEEKDLPVREDHALRPLHPYGVSKVAQDLLAWQYFYNYSIPTVRIRIFNTTGPGKIGDVCADVTQRAVEIELGRREPRMPIGNLHTKRSLLDVRDLVRALWLAAERCEPGEAYNVGGSQVLSVGELIALVADRCVVPFTLVADARLLRPADEKVIAGDTRKFEQATGWRPETSLGTTLAEMLEWWRAVLGAGSSGNSCREAANFTA